MYNVISTYIYCMCASNILYKAIHTVLGQVKRIDYKIKMTITKSLCVIAVCSLMNMV